MYDLPFGGFVHSPFLGGGFFPGRGFT
ncbi:Protein of unknown function [Bacillus mycoides]|nr:Protein of unknown function [Bacillus mycoides]